LTDLDGNTITLIGCFREVYQQKAGFVGISAGSRGFTVP